MSLGTLLYTGSMLNGAQRKVLESNRSNGVGCAYMSKEFGPESSGGIGSKPCSSTFTWVVGFHGSLP